MRGWALMVVCLAVASAAVEVTPQEEVTPQQEVTPQEEVTPPEVTPQEVTPQEEATPQELSKPEGAAIDTDARLSPEISDRERFFGVASTRTYTSVVMVTSTVFFSCLSGTSKAVCQGRRKKKSMQRFLDLTSADEGDAELDGSLGEVKDKPDVEDTAPKSPDSPVSNDAKFITIWTSSQTTTTVTMLYTNTSTTIRLSYFCQAGQAQLPIFRCAGGG
ncbi:uncharacterized protein [Procambarus clarkii]